MKTLIKSLSALLLTLPAALLTAPAVLAAGGETFPHDAAPIDLGNKAAMQRGAGLYVNYCMGCHSLQYQRYNRLARDLDIDETLAEKNLILTPDAKIGDTMEIAMSRDDGKQWFGAEPPDLTLIARSRGADYLYNYLRAFYLDPSRPLGVNNSVKVVNMPHALWELEGWKEPVYASAEGADGEAHQVLTGFEIVEPGALSSDEYDRAVADLVNFLVYVGEPIRQERVQRGIWVLLFLFLALIVFYLLKKEYWKDVH